LVDESGAVGATFDIDRADGKWSISNRAGTVLASGKSPAGKVSLESFGRDGTSVIYNTPDETTGDVHWFEVSLKGGDPVEIWAGQDVKELIVDQSNGRLLGYRKQSDSPRLHFLDPAKQATYAKIVRAFPKLNVSIVDQTPDFGKVIVHTDGNADSGTWYEVDMATLRADPVGYDRPAIPPEAVGAISSVEYHASDGLAMNGILTLPPGRQAKNLPVIVLPHDGPASHDETAFDWTAQAFASRGYAVFQPNFRGSTNQDGAFRHAGDGEWGGQSQTDIADGLAELVKRGIVDPKRACIVGTGYGGYAALAGVTMQHGLYRCAVAIAAYTDLSSFFNVSRHESGYNPMTKLQLSHSLGDPATYAALSPRRHAAEADAPILLIHGKNDTVVPFDQSTAMADALKDAGKPYEFVVLKDEDHWLSHAATRQQMLEAAVAFVQKNNPANESRTLTAAGGTP
jgi:dipeptidyl aminopeptidase/acylaminoacyl peptidase